jgi:hypothetical protein
VPDICVESVGDKFVVRVNCEVEREQMTQGLEAIEADISTESDGGW